MKGFRTYLVAFLMALLPAATAYFEGFDWVGFLTSVGVPQQWVMPLAGLMAAIVMTVMRSITNTPPAAKE